MKPIRLTKLLGQDDSDQQRGNRILWLRREECICWFIDVTVFFLEFVQFPRDRIHPSQLIRLRYLCPLFRKDYP